MTECKNSYVFYHQLGQSLLLWPISPQEKHRVLALFLQSLSIVYPDCALSKDASLTSLSSTSLNNFSAAAHLDISSSNPKFLF